MDKENNVKKIEREYTIPLRREWGKVPRYKRANKAVKAVKEFLARHMKIRDRDLNKVKIDKFLNEELWFRGIRNPPSRIKVKAVREGEIVKAELAEMPEILKFKKARQEKAEQKSGEAKPKHEQSERQSAVHKEGEEHKHEESEEKKSEAKEKEATSMEATQKMEKETAKKMKHQTKQSKQPKHPVRQALQK